MPRKPASNDASPPTTTDPMQRIANLLALSVTKDMRQKDKVVLLSAAGFSSAEIAALIGTTTHVVSQTLYEAKKKGKGAKKAPGRRAKTDG